MSKEWCATDANAERHLFKVEEMSRGMPEIISEETFVDLLQMQNDDDDMPTDIEDTGWEDDDIDNDGLMYLI